MNLQPQKAKLDTGSLLDERLARFAGPALLAYNDGQFTEADLQSISHVGSSVKRSQLGKTGRFGLATFFFLRGNL